MDTSDSTLDIPLKQCSRKENCVHPLGSWLPATVEFFTVSDRRGYFSSWCRACRKKYQQRKREERKLNPRYFCIDCGKPITNSTASRCRECYQRDRSAITEYKECSRKEKCVNPLGSILPRTSEYFPSNKVKYDGLSTQCRACFSQTRKRWKSNNRDKVNAYERTRNRPKSNPEYQRRYREAHREQNRRYSREHKEEKRVYYQRYKARKKQLPESFTPSQWDRAVQYFGGCCAVCGRQLNDLFRTHAASADHWIPISDSRLDNPGTVAVNIIPLCIGKDGCNNSKSNRPAEEWLIERFGKRRAREILNRIEDYFQWVRDQDKDGGE